MPGRTERRPDANENRYSGRPSRSQKNRYAGSELLVNKGFTCVPLPRSARSPWFAWDVRVTCGERQADGGSRWELLGLIAEPGCELVLEAKGSEGEEALDRLSALVAAPFQGSVVEDGREGTQTSIGRVARQPCGCSPVRFLSQRRRSLARGDRAACLSQMAGSRVPFRHRPSGLARCRSRTEGGTRPRKAGLRAGQRTVASSPSLVSWWRCREEGTSHPRPGRDVQPLRAAGHGETL
jgi:hypothetical protein